MYIGAFVGLITWSELYCPHLQEKLSSFFFDILTLENETDMLSRNVINKHKNETSEDLNVLYPTA